MTRQACSPLIQLFFGFASDIDQIKNINRDIRDGNWLSSDDDCAGGTDDGDGGSPADKVANVVEQKAASWDKVGLLVKEKTLW